MENNKNNDTKDSEISPISLQESQTKSTILASEGLWHFFILLSIFICAICIRLISVLRYESIIHEFDPWFNFRATNYLVEEGAYKWINWFDKITWYPLGRYVGSTTFPGLMATSAFFYHFLHFFHIDINIRDICVMMGPIMSGCLSIAMYLFTSEVWNSRAGLISAMLTCLSPALISRSMAGSYDNECIAIFALIFCFYWWVRSVRTGYLSDSLVCSFTYFFMVSCWGGYIFIANIIPFHCLVLILTGRYSSRIYVSYSVWHIIGTICSFNIPFISFIPVTATEHLPQWGIFFLLNFYMLIEFIRGILLDQKKRKWLLRLSIIFAFFSLIIFILLVFLGFVPFVTARLLSLVGSTSNIAIVKSVSEHQPTPWSNFFQDINIVIFLVPAGIYLCFTQLTDSNIFLLLYIMFSAYFSSIFVRLVLVLSPAACCAAGIAIHQLLSAYSSLASSTNNQPQIENSGKSEKKKEKEKDKQPFQQKILSFSSRFSSLLLLLAFILLTSYYVLHSVWAASALYSSPSIVLISTYGKERIVFDDFRESYLWLRYNTHPDSRILSWWDYGYQITGMGNRTTLVDNNTRNNTHIACAGYIMASSEENGIKMVRHLDVDYVLVIFGGMIGYSSDDINKFLWMVRISGGVFPDIIEKDYYTPNGHYRQDKEAPPAMINSLMYRLSYYRFGEVMAYPGTPSGFDRVRNYEIGLKEYLLKYYEEAFTSEHWMVRIYRVKQKDNIK